MTEPTITISLNYTVPAGQASATLQELLKLLPAASSAINSTPQAVHKWPAIPTSVDDEYRRRAEQNLMKLRTGVIEDEGWGNVKDLATVIKSLRDATRMVILRAIDNGGHVSRDEVYELIGRDEDKTLKGFTRPAVAVTTRLTKEGQLGEEFKPLLKPVYAKSKSFQAAQGFVIPLQIVRMLKLQ